ncbi:MAG: hypothetical protein DRG78_20390 [Epsilonproteobacteria bacterium]|nr:MAG: hypothetical protein DRG78_20390 [Campylobacterota bacterium]
MKYLYILISFFALLPLSASQTKLTDFTVDMIPKQISISVKKNRFFSLIVAPVQKVHLEFIEKYLRIKNDMQNNTNLVEIQTLKEYYNIKTDLELLYALKPHPQSIVLAQAAMESAWGTSRFFREANNIFGMWSSNPKEPRIAAGIKRKGIKTIWLKKFKTLEASIRSYYRLMAKGKSYKAFRKTRYETDDVHLIVKKLDKYSEIGDLYGKQLSHVIRFNELTKYDK